MKQALRSKWLEYSLLGLIVALSLGLRLYKINLPIADHHSWRQADTAAVARNFIKEGFDFLRPRIDNMAPLRLGELNPGRLFLVEPPIYQTIVVVLYRLFGVHEYLARSVSIIFSLGGIIFLYLLVKHFTNRWIGLLASFFMGTLPYSIFFSRVVMPESEMIFVSLGMIYFFVRFLQKETWYWWFLTLVFTCWSFLTKTFPFFLFLPMAYLAWRKWKLNIFKQKSLYLLLFLAIIPFVLWRFWVAHFPEGVPPNQWLLNWGGGEFSIRFRPAFFRWIFAERIGKLILGYWGLPLFALGLLAKPSKKEGWFFYLWLSTFLIYVSIFAAGNVTHDYYQIPFIPIVSFFLARGVWWLLTTATKNVSRIVSYLLLIVCFVFMIGFSWYEVRGFYNIQGGVDLAGLAVDRLTPKDALIITGDSNDSTLLYNCNRYGWTGGHVSYFPNEESSIKRAISLRADFYVTTKINELKSTGFGDYMYKKFAVIEETNQFVIFNLNETAK